MAEEVVEVQAEEEVLVAEAALAEGGEVAAVVAAALSSPRSGYRVLQPLGTLQLKRRCR